MSKKEKEIFDPNKKEAKELLEVVREVIAYEIASSATSPVLGMAYALERIQQGKLSESSQKHIVSNMTDQMDSILGPPGAHLVRLLNLQKYLENIVKK